jgi:hypothetical protein
MDALQMQLLPIFASLVCTNISCHPRLQSAPTLTR